MREISENPMDRVDPPRLEEQPVPVLLDSELRAVLAAGEAKSFTGRIFV
ncbi:MAG: hypothetical protein WD895_09590 [Acidimicrobiia bacterium]